MTTKPGKPPSSDNQQIARAAGTVMFAIVLSQLTGLLAKILTAGAFGAGSELDAFFAANRVSEILFNLVAGGALGSAFIPVFTTFLTKDNNNSAWRLASAIGNLITLTLTLLCTLAAIFAPQVVRYILAPGFTDPDQFQLTVTLLRILLPSAIIFGLSGLMMGILNAHQIFLFPSLAPSMYQIGWIIGVVVLAPIMGIYGLAWGTVLGALLHLLLQLPVILRLPKRKYTAWFGLKMAAVREVAILMAPRLLGVAIVQLNFLLNTFLASNMPEGSLTGISLAFPLMIMPQAAIAQSIAIAALPTFSAQVARGHIDKMRSSLAATMRGVILLAIPATLGLIILRYPIVSLLYEHGEFTEAFTILVTWALLWYAAGLVGHSLLEVISRAFYALHDTRTPVFIGVAAMSLNLILSILFSKVFRQVGWAPHGGLALANSLATAIEVTILLILMRRRLKGLQGRDLLDGAVRACTAALAMGAVLWFWEQSSRNMADLWVVIGGVTAGGLVYVMMLFVLQMRELKQGWSFVQTRLSRLKGQ